MHLRDKRKGRKNPIGEQLNINFGFEEQMTCTFI